MSSFFLSFEGFSFRGHLVGMITRDGEWGKMVFFWVVWLGREIGGDFGEAQEFSS